MTTDKEIVSVIIPAYNAGSYVEQTISSVLGQTYVHIEVIVVNDGSKDDTPKKISAFKDDRLKIITQSNSGVSAARNKGYQSATGKYICFLDADDLYTADNIREKKLFLDENPHIGLVHSNMEVIDENSAKTGEVMSGKEGDVLNDLLLWEACVIPTPSSTMIRREVLAAKGLFNEQLSNNADQELFFRIASKYKIGKIDKPLVQYRKHALNMHNNISLLEKDSLLAYSLAEKNNLFESWAFKRRCYANMYAILGACFWKDANKKLKGIFYLVRAFISYPFILPRFLSKLMNK